MEHDPEFTMITSPSGLNVLHHRLYVGIPFTVEHDNACLNNQRESLAEAERTHDWESYVFIHARPYRVDALAEVLALCDDKPRVSSLAGLVWSDTEHPHQNEDLWHLIFEQIDPREMMTAEERQFLDNLTGEITIYRGGNEDGFSWTLSRNTAQWFANRFGKGEDVHERRVNASDIKVYLSGRNEEEVLIW